MAAGPSRRRAAWSLQRCRPAAAAQPPRELRQRCGGGDGLRLSGTGYWRENNTRSFNGDASEFELCRFAGGARALLEEPDDTEDALQDDLDIELDEICEGDQTSIRSFVDLENFIQDRARALGLDEDDYELEDISGDLSIQYHIPDDYLPLYKQGDYGIELMQELMSRLQREKDIFFRIYSVDKSLSRLPHGSSSSLHVDNLDEVFKFVYMECVAAGCCRQFHRLCNELLLIPPQMPQVWDCIISEVVKYRPSLDDVEDDDDGKYN